MGEIGQIPNHQVKVDNWPLFFLQRLHHFYRKKSHCDLTLLFSTIDTVKSIKVHKLVLHACTDYFESLDVMKDSEHGEFLQLSNEMHPDVVIPIISFMYTGKLEFPVTLQPRLYEVATKLRMTILTKLLDVQPQKISEKSDETSVLQTNVQTRIECNQDGVDISTVSPSNLASSVKNVEDPIITLTPVSKNISHTRKIFKPEVTFIQQSDSADKTNIQNNIKSAKKNLGSTLTSVNSKPKVADVNLPPTLPGRKLPVWKRKVPLTVCQSSENLQNVRSALRTELPKPTRFEWDEDLNDPTVLRPVEDSPKILSHDGPLKIIHPIILDGEVSKQRDVSDNSYKRSSDGGRSESPPFKKSRSDLQDMKEHGKQQQLRNEIICSEENSDDMMDADDLYGTCDDEPDDLENFNQSSINCSTPKPILKTVSKPEPPVTSKRVRFSLEGKENNQQQNETSVDFTMSKQEPTVAKQKIVFPVDASQMQSGKHHVKIVSEVLKKFPDLAKRENIKLRVVSKNPAAVPPIVQKAVEGETGGGSKSASSLVSYIFLTNKGSGEIMTVKNETNEKDKGFDVENKTGPWLCHVCNEQDPLEFDSYYTYRRHLVEVHELKIDARICEYCGLKNSKRNHLLYHLYTKHGINPPAHVSFPKCPECDYIALSDALLFKHKATHDPKGLMCYTCNIAFKTYSAMQLHLHSEWHRNKLAHNEKLIELSGYPCPFCEVRFESGNDLKDHMETSHHSQLQFAAEADASSEAESAKNQSSSEVESLNNVPSEIATSLNVTGKEQSVLYYEQKSQEHDIGKKAINPAEGECKEYVIAEPVADINKQPQVTSEAVEIIEVENEDPGSKNSNAEEVNGTSASDHDYSEVQVEENFRQIIPIQTVTNEITEGSVIQQIVPDQGLLFSSQGNVVFQSPCVNLPQRVLLTSGKVVLPGVSGEQNVILSQVIPQTQIILSSSILQQPGSIIEDGNSAIVFTSSDATQIENIQTVHYQIETPETEESDTQETLREESCVIRKVNHIVERKGEKEKKIEVIENVQKSFEAETADIKENQNESKNENEKEGEKEKKNEKETENEKEKEKEKETETENKKEIEKKKEKETETETEKETEKETKIENENKNESENNNENIKENKNLSDSDITNVKLGKEKKEGASKFASNSAPEDQKSINRVEASKIVDDWDEMNESSHNVENRGDGPSRPEFF